MAKNAILILIDALRYDVFADLDAARMLCPNLTSLAERGFVLRAVANAPSTQMVMPSLFSLSYPLDYGGYNAGIRERPASFPEQLREAGYSTHLIAACNMLGSWNGYNRGFDEVHTTYDCRHVLQYLIEKTLYYDIDLWQRGERSEEDTLEIVAKEMELVLRGVEEVVKSADHAVWPAELVKVNRRVALGCKGERELLAAQPRVVLAKLRDIRPIFYWRYLGERGPGGDYQYWRLIESFKWRSRRLLSKLNAPVLLLTHFETKADKIIHGICEQLPAANSPWFLYSHLMDVHDCASASRLGHFLGRLRFFPTWLVARLSGKTKRRAIYDMALMYVDRKLGLLLKHLEASGVLDDTVLLVTGDHGSAYAGTTHAGLDIGERTHVEHIEVPLIVAGVDRQPSAEGIVDTMGIASTLLDALDVPKHASFLGCSAFARGPVAVITETAGRGNADVERRDLYFTVTTAQYRMMSVLKQAQLHVLHLFDRIADPEEANDLARREEQRASINTLIGHLFTERGALLAERGVDATAPPLTPPPLAS